MNSTHTVLVFLSIATTATFVPSGLGVTPTTATSTQQAGRDEYTASIAAAEAFNRARDSAKAIDAYHHAILTAPNDQAKTAAQRALAAIRTEQHQYVSLISAAQAYSRLGEEDKAIEAYRQAIVAAPDDSARKAAEDALQSVGTVKSSFASSLPKHVLQVIKWPLGTIVALALVGLAFAVLFWLFGLLRRLSGGVRLVIESDSTEITGAYAASCITAALLSFQEQASSLAKVAQLSAFTSAAPTPTLVDSARSFSVNSIDPLALDKGWLSLLLQFHPRIFSRASASFALELRAVKPKESLGLSIILRQRLCCLGSWRPAGSWQIPVTCQDLSTAVDDALYSAVVTMLQACPGQSASCR